LLVTGIIGLLANPVQAGTLSGELIPGAALNRNLSHEGFTDWAIWGFAAAGTSTSLAPDVRKSGGTGISSLTDITNGTALRGLGQFGSFAHTFDWNDGSPVAGAAGATGGLQHFTDPPPSPVGEGFSFTVPANPQPQIVRVYVATHEGTGTLTASLSDASAPSFIHTQGDNQSSNVPGVFEITYTADSPGQTLTISFVLTQAPTEDPNVQIHAVSLAAAIAVAPALSGLALLAIATILLAGGTVVLRSTRSRRMLLAGGALSPRAPA
jgi:hypothetical protein